MDTSFSSTPQRPAAQATLWQVQVLGGLELDSGNQRLTRLPSRAVAALLARLALWPQRLHPREELVELLWPGVELAVGRNRLRQALSTLKSLIEPPGAPVVLQADRLGVRVVSGALGCDAREFEALVRAGRHAEALALYRGELLPGFYDDWIDEERLRLAALRDRIVGDTQAHTNANTGTALRSPAQATTDVVTQALARPTWAGPRCPLT
jgi:DNA-binding SARP family transcriptional activator